MIVTICRFWRYKVKQIVATIQIFAAINDEIPAFSDEMQSRLILTPQRQPIEVVTCRKRDSGQTAVQRQYRARVMNKELPFPQPNGDNAE